MPESSYSVQRRKSERMSFNDDHLLQTPFTHFLGGSAGHLAAWPHISEFGGTHTHAPVILSLDMPCPPDEKASQTVFSHCICCRES